MPDPLDTLDPDCIRALAETLIAHPSISPDSRAERACAEAVRAAFPADASSGAWETPDGRLVPWALVRGRTPRTVIMLGHVDTVGVAEYASLGAAEGERIAFRPEALKQLLIAQSGGGWHPALRGDLEQERHAPGTWMFGRGALDMKSGLAAGVAALHELAARGDALPGSALLVACPDEESESAGMALAVRELVSLGEREGLEYLGALNLDYGVEPVAYAGVAGKLLAQVYVLGDPTHASEPFRGVDATQLAAGFMSRATVRRELMDRWEQRRGPPPAALRLRDLKPRYDTKTALEAIAELNLIIYGRSLESTMSALRQTAIETMAEVSASMARLAEESGIPATSRGTRGAVLTYPELVERAGLAPTEDPLGPEGAGKADPREATLERMRRLARRARLAGPAMVLALVPPYYPHAAPGHGPLPRAARTALARHGIELRPFYPHISDAAYLSWRGEPAEAVARFLPALGREYELPVEASRILDLDVVNLGPWGRDAHGLFERVHAPYAFGTLPRLIVDVTIETLAQ